MKRIAVFFIALTCLVGAADFGYAGTATANLTVSATVAGACLITTTPVSFGTVVVAPAFSTAQGSVSVTCTAGQAWTVTLNRGAAPAGSGRAMIVGGITMVGYELYHDAGLTQIWGDSGFAGTYPAGSGVAGVGSGAAQTTTVFGRASALSTAPAGNYLDIVSATVNF